MKGRGSKSI